MPDPNAAGWGECVTHVRDITKNPNAQDVASVDWSKISQDDLNNGFSGDTPFPLICPGRHCIEGVNQSPAGHRFCDCKDVNGNPVVPCTPKTLLDPYLASACINTAGLDPDGKNWGKTGRNCTNLDKVNGTYYDVFCWCCCSCFANGTLVSSPTGVKKIEDYQIGDKVLAAAMSGGAGSIKLEWSPARVGFSFGTSDGTEQGMVFLRYGSGTTMVCTPDQLFLLATGKIIRADRLVPGRDQFVAPDGTPVALYEISLGVYKGGVHHIATEPGFKGDPQGHLLSSAGIVSGDFDLQIHADQIDAQYLVPDHDALPVVGSTAYENAYPQLTKTDIATYDSDGGAKAHKSHHFFSHKQQQYDIPDDAAAFLTADQSDDIAKANLSATFDRVLLHNKSADNLLKTWSGHYPQIKFLHLLGHMEVNAYAYTIHDQPYVVLTDGLTRLSGMDYEGMALIVAHLKVRLSKGMPAGANGWMSVGMADYYAGTEIQSVYIGPSLQSIIGKGVKQIQTALFDHIDKKSHDAYKGDPYQPTTQTRADAFTAGLRFQYPPEGIGGPVEGGLKVTGAQVSLPQFTAASFVASGVTADDSKQVYQSLIDKGILDSKGTLVKPATPKTDLSFLFPNAEAGDKPFLVNGVLANLISSDSHVAIRFNQGVSIGTVHVGDFDFTPPAIVRAATGQLAAPDTLNVAVKLASGKYTIAVRDIHSTDGSTLDQDQSTAEVTVP
jgi:hypothetical protein